MNIVVAAAWGLSGALVAAGIELVNVCKHHDAYPWDLARHAKTHKRVKVSLSGEERKSARLRYLVTVAVTGGIGAVTAACATSSGAIKDPIAATGVGLAALQVPRLFALHTALTLESWVRPRPGDCDGGGDGESEGVRDADRDDSARGRLSLGSPDQTEAAQQ
jgi:hypothetical protein